VVQALRRVLLVLLPSSRSADDTSEIVLGLIDLRTQLQCLHKDS
jgi:hypothetical protein